MPCPKHAKGKNLAHAILCKKYILLLFNLSQRIEFISCPSTPPSTSLHLPYFFSWECETFIIICMFLLPWISQFRVMLGFCLIWVYTEPWGHLFVIIILLWARKWLFLPHVFFYITIVSPSMVVVDIWAEYSRGSLHSSD